MGSEQAATTRQWRRDAIVAIAGLCAIAAVVGVLHAAQEHPNPTIAALLFLLIVLATATVSHLRVSVGISVAAMLVFNFFLLPPFYALTIADPQNWVALFVFIVVAVIASQLSASARRRASEAERADLASALLASFSHDLRTPVTAVRVAVTNLQDVRMPLEERRTQVHLALHQLDRLTRLFQNILDMARIDAAAVNPERQWVAPADVVDAAIAHVGPALAEHTLQVDADGVSEIRVDPRLTSTALAHVLENAVRYSAHETTIAIRAWTDADGGHFVVRDHGPGVDASDLDHLFEPFYRGQNTRHATGTGLGLAITLGLLAAEGGRIWCENVPDGGAQFTITVPSPVRVAHAPAS
jgi:two-component system sensor histidine kinase KdpD